MLRPTLSALAVIILSPSSALSQGQQETLTTAECIAEANRRNVPSTRRDDFIRDCSSGVLQECNNEANRRMLPIGSERSIFLTNCRSELRQNRAADPTPKPSASEIPPQTGAKTPPPSEASAAQAPLWNLSTDSATRTLFGTIEIGGKIALATCQTGSPMQFQLQLQRRACRIEAGRYGAFPQFAISVNYVYLPWGPGLPEWITPAPNGLSLPNCANALPSRQQTCQQERERLSAQTPPRPSMIVIVYAEHVIEALFFGPVSMCDIGARAFEQKWGRPSFVNNQGTNLDWNTKDFGASVLCGSFDAPQPLKHLIGDTLPNNLAQYTVRLVAPFESFSRAEQTQQIRERERIGSTGPKL